MPVPTSKPRASARPRRKPAAAAADRGDPGLLQALGRRVRALREERGMPRARLAEESGLSLRFLAQVESGTGNISVSRLAGLSRALEVTLPELLAQALAPAAAGRSVLALLGLRGAGKSTLGREAAETLGLEFLEHDRLVEESAGMSLEELFALHGDGLYRRLARETLERLVAAPGPPCILATGGGVVADPDALDLLASRTTTVWLAASPEDHWNRVVAQGDRRPMKDRPAAMEELRRLLARRAPLYARAEHRVDTSKLGFKASLRALTALGRRFAKGAAPAA